MLKFFKTSILFSAIMMAFVINSTPVQAQDDTFDLTVKHNINGRSLGLEKALPVDVYANGGYLFTFNFGETKELPGLDAGIYYIEVKFAGTNTNVMTLGPEDIPAGVSVRVRAQLSGEKTPVLRVNIK